MGMRRSGSVLIGMLAVAVMALGVVPAAAKTYRVSGRQIFPDPNKPTGKMTGGLRGTWTGTNFEMTAEAPPLNESKGTETFSGCIDRKRDKSCKGDPKGTLNFTFLFWGMPGAQPNTTLWGSCYHPITSGTGAFAGANGVLMMVDTPIGDGTKARTDYIGNITLGAAARHKATAARAMRC